ncbi:MAG: carboxylating nicotinate-nucleotide diphosphorylase [Eubacteriaceae bacterium]|nr:carboxylating nicotinate-nucleotide diphosphorylase [Eubacteriaceae bacterium]
MQYNIDNLIFSALREDMPSEDISTNSIIKKYALGKADLICKQDGFIAGIDVFKRVFEILDKKIDFNIFYKDGDEVKNKVLVAEIIGDIKAILSAERTALNYLQRMSGIASYTRKAFNLLKDTNIKLLDTRKTTPNNRIFEKYAVKAGGGHNHRFCLSDGVMLKDNHIAAAGGIKKAVQMARNYAPITNKIEVEVENLDMLKEALDAKADIIMLDNMDIETIKKAVEITDKRALLECSGNVTIEKIESLKDTGIDYISSGALTHSAGILDLSLKNLRRL